MSATAISVERILLRRVRIPMREPFRISNGTVSEKESIVIQVQAAGHSGYGEASPMPGSFYSKETPESTWDTLVNDLIPDIFSRTIANPVQYADSLNRFKYECFARAGIEGAVWDLFASLLGTTIRELLGIPHHNIPSGLAVGMFDTVDALLERIEHYLRDGYRRIKIKIAPGWDLEPLTAVRKRFGDIPLMVDANASYELAEHREILRALDRFNLVMIEQPLAADALEDSADLMRSIRTPICLDESADSMESLEEIIRLNAAGIINIKVQRVGGLWNAKLMEGRAREAGLSLWLGTMPELGIASAQALEIASLPGFVYPTDIEASTRWFHDDIVEPQISIGADGCIAIPPMGYRASEEKIERYTLSRKEFQR